MLFWFGVLVLVLVVVVTVATPAATGSNEDVFVDTDDAGSLSVNVTDVVVDDDDDDDDGDTGDKTASGVFEIIILGSCVRMMVDEEGGLLWGILLLEQQSRKIGVGEL